MFCLLSCLSSSGWAPPKVTPREVSADEIKRRIPTLSGYPDTASDVLFAIDAERSVSGDDFRHLEEAVERVTKILTKDARILGEHLLDAGFSLKKEFKKLFPDIDEQVIYGVISASTFNNAWAVKDDQVLNRMRFYFRAPHEPKSFDGYLRHIKQKCSAIESRIKIIPNMSIFVEKDKQDIENAIPKIINFVKKEIKKKIEDEISIEDAGRKSILNTRKFIKQEDCVWMESVLGYGDTEIVFPYLNGEMQELLTYERVLKEPSLMGEEIFLDEEKKTVEINSDLLFPKDIFFNYHKDIAKVIGSENENLRKIMRKDFQAREVRVQDVMGKLMYEALSYDEVEHIDEFIQKNIKERSQEFSKSEEKILIEEIMEKIDKDKKVSDGKKDAIDFYCKKYINRLFSQK